jgi:putative tributyrin esterase
MITTTVNFLSKTLGLRSELNVLLPQRNLSAVYSGKRPKYQTLFLLHGLSDDHTAWQRWTSLERYAENMNLAVVMPSVHRSFYSNMDRGGKYWSFISEEIPSLVRDIFPLSGDCQDNFVAGLSMGGYGAFKLALSHPDRFSAAASLSGALDVQASYRGGDATWRAELESIFGDMKSFSGGSNDLFALARKAANSLTKPRIYQLCGIDDFLYEDNLRFRDYIQPLGFDYLFEESRGDHTWEYWDSMLKKTLVWIKSK